jgi:diacylglycerol kinase
MLNTAIEKLADKTHPEQHPQIGLVKDVAAGAVLWASVISVIIGAVIFLPLILARFG